MARLHNGRLVIERTLKCVKYPYVVDAASIDSLYVCDRLDVYVIDVLSDKVTAALEKPKQLHAYSARCLAALGDKVMVCYKHENDLRLVVYCHGSLTPVITTHCPEGMCSLSAMSADGPNHILLSDCVTNSVFVVDVDGSLRYQVSLLLHGYLYDCAVVNKQLWVSSLIDHLTIMSEQTATSAFTLRTLPDIFKTFHL